MNILMSRLIRLINDSISEQARDSGVPCCSKSNWWLCSICKVRHQIRLKSWSPFENNFLIIIKFEKKFFLSNLIYYSDKPGNHDFKILKKLVLPNGSVLRARFAGRPTRDCLFEDPVMDGKRYVTSYCLSLRMA